MTPEQRRAASPPVQSTDPIMRGVALGIPFCLAAIVGYVLYLVTEHILWELFFRQNHRHGLLVGLAVPYAIIATLMVASYLRIFITARIDSAVVPLGPDSNRFYYGRNHPRRRQGNGCHGRAARPQPSCRILDKHDSNNSSPLDLESGLATSAGSNSFAPVAGSASLPPPLPPTPPPDPRLDPDSPGLELFYTRDVFQCSPDGRPLWCNECGTWKPDRTHHSSELNRCVRKLDHYCPWVGGVVSETTFKFFVQFNIYAALLCALTISISSYALALQQQHRPDVDVRIIVALGFACFLGMFSGTMSITCLHLTFTNQTSVELHQRRDRPKMMAVRIRRGSPPVEGRYNVVTYPLPKVEPPTVGYQTIESNNQPTHSPYEVDIADGDADGGMWGCHEDDFLRQSRADSEAPLHEYRDVDNETHKSIVQPGSLRTEEDPLKTSTVTAANRSAARDLLAFSSFAIIPVRPGMNVWDLGWYKNWVSVMGNNPLDWLLPFNLSPCCVDNRNLLVQRSFYRLGPAFQKLCAEYNLPPYTEIPERQI